MAINTDKVDAIVLAGGINHIELYPGYTPGYKSLLEVGGRPSIVYTLEALAATSRINRVCIVGPADELRPALAKHLPGRDYEFIDGGETFFESVEHGLRHLQGDDFVMVATADIPLITAGAIRDFLEACDGLESKFSENICISLVPREAYIGPYEQFTKHFNPFRDVEVCHGNLLLVDPGILDNEEATSRINAIYNARKNPLGTARAVGLRVGLSYAFGVEVTSLLSLQRMARIASWRFKLGLLPVLIDHPEITIDIDEPADYQFVLHQLEAAA